MTDKPKTFTRKEFIRRTCSGLDHEFIGSMAVAMSNMDEIEGNARAVGTASV